MFDVFKMWFADVVMFVFAFETALIISLSLAKIIIDLVKGILESFSE